MMGRVYSIDPGLSGTGWAEWTGRQVPDRVGVIHYSSGCETLARKCEDISEKLVRLMRVGGEFDDDVHVYLEMPQQMTNIRGLAAQGGAVYKLAFFVGYLARAVYPCTPFEVSPGEWKGQLPKDVVQRRIERHLGEEKCRELGISTHAWDAVGLGLWALGKWKD